jgi:hypothetical protein
MKFLQEGDPKRSTILEVSDLMFSDPTSTLVLDYSLILLKRKKHMAFTYCSMGGCVLITPNTISLIESWRVMGGYVLIDLCVRIGESTHTSCIAQSVVHVEISSDMQALRRTTRKYSRRACSKKSSTEIRRNKCLLDQLAQVFSTSNHVPIASYA